MQLDNLTQKTSLYFSYQGQHYHKKKELTSFNPTKNVNMKWFIGKKMFFFSIFIKR